MRLLVFLVPSYAFITPQNTPPPSIPTLLPSAKLFHPAGLDLVSRVRRLSSIVLYIFKLTRHLQLSLLL